MIEQINELLFMAARDQDDKEIMIRLSSLSGIDIVTLIRIRDKRKPVTLYQLITLAKVLKTEITVSGAQICLTTTDGKKYCTTVKGI